MFIASLCSCEIIENNNQEIEEMDRESQIVYETKEQAEKYAVNLFKEKYPDVNIEDYNIITNDESEEYWVVYTIPKDKTHKNIKGGGGPSVKFKKWMAVFWKSDYKNNVPAK